MNSGKNVLVTGGAGFIGSHTCLELLHAGYGVVVVDNLRNSSRESLRPGLASYARASYLRELHGETGGAIEAMRMAADAGATGKESRAWALYQLGNLYLNENQPDTAAFLTDIPITTFRQILVVIHGLVGANDCRRRAPR